MSNKKKNAFFRDRPRPIMEEAILELLEQGLCPLEDLNKYLKEVSHE